jgi:hypothetical protein
MVDYLIDDFENKIVATHITPLDDALPLPRVDPDRKVFITSRGDEIELSGKMVSSLMLERISNEGKPRIPQTEVTLLGKHKQMQSNPNDAGYLALMKEWEAEQKIAIMRYIFVIGAKGQPPADFIEDQLQFFPDASAMELKYLWVSSRLPDSDIDSFTEAILGQNITTVKGLEEAANFSESKSTDTP